MAEDLKKFKVSNTIERTIKNANLNVIWDRLDEEFGVDSDHANMFTEQEMHQDEIWIKTRRKQVIKNIEGLPAEEQRECQHSFRKLKSDIKNFINKLEENPKSRNNGVVAIQLKNALSTPKDQLAYIQSSIDINTNLSVIKPVLVFWGFRKSETIQYNEDGISGDGTQPKLDPASTGISGDGSPPKLDPPPTPPISPTPPTPSTPSTPFWWWVPSQYKAWYVLLWILITGLICYILWLLFVSCSVSLFKGHKSCIKDQAFISNDIRNQNLLSNQVKSLERELLLLQSNCQSPGPKIEKIDSATYSEVQERLSNADAGSGEVNVTLSWDNVADLDLHLQCTNGQIVNYKNMKKNKNNCGELDVDANYPSGNTSNTPIEHIFIDKAEFGDYKIIVKNISASRFKDVKFKLLIDILGKKELISNENMVKHKNISQYEYKFQVKKD
jgi:hypothetical protein